MEATVDLYAICKKFPEDEKYGLVSQVRRSAVSIPSNIAEGAARNSTTEFARFLTIAIASLSELDTQLELSLRLNYVSETEFQNIDNKLASISRMLIALRKRILSK
jgi:four helix bundle protein